MKAEYLGHQISLDRLDARSVIVDAGASRGAFIRWLRKQEQTEHSRVYAVEPARKNLSVLRRTPLGNTVIEGRALVGQNSPDKVMFTEYDNLPGWGNIFEDMYRNMKGARYEVGVIKINNIFRFFGIPRIDYLKMDIEGAEYEIFKTMTEETASKIAEISLENHKPPPHGLQIDWLVEDLTRLGFKCELFKNDREIWARKK